MYLYYTINFIKRNVINIYKNNNNCIFWEYLVEANEIRYKIIQES